MVCIRCRQQVADNTIVCPHCGINLQQAMAQAQQGMQQGYQQAAQAQQQVQQGYQQAAQQMPQGYPQQPQGFQQAPQQAPQGYPQQPQGFQQAPQQAPRQVPPQAPQGYPQQPQGYQQAPQGYPQQPQGYQQVPQGYPQQQMRQPAGPGGLEGLAMKLGTTKNGVIKQIISMAIGVISVILGFAGPAFFIGEGVFSIMYYPSSIHATFGKIPEMGFIAVLCVLYYVFMGITALLLLLQIFLFVNKVAKLNVNVDVMNKVPVPKEFINTLPGMAMYIVICILIVAIFAGLTNAGVLFLSGFFYVESALTLGHAAVLFCMKN